MALMASRGTFNLTETGLTVLGEPSYDQWAEALAQARLWHSAIQWVVGALVNYGEAHFGEQASQLLDASRWEEETIRVYAWVESRVPPENRRPELPFHAHQLVASLPPEAQRLWLDRAAKGDEVGRWSTRRLQAKMREAAVEAGASLPCWLVVRCESVDDAEALQEKLQLEGRVCKLHPGKVAAAPPPAGGD